MIDAQVIRMLEKIVLPKDVYDWAMAYLKNIFEKDVNDAEQELRNLKKRATEAQATLDTLLLKAAQTEDNLAEEFVRLARQKQRELALLQQRTTQIAAGKQENNSDATKILELAQLLAAKYVTFPQLQKRQIVDSVFLNLQLDDISLCGEYRLPFAILAENRTYPVNSG